VRDRVRYAIEAMLAVNDRGELSGLRVLSKVGLRLRGDDEHVCEGVAVVANLVTALRPSRKGNDIGFDESALAVVHADRGFSAQHDQQLLGAVMEVVDARRRRGLELPERRAGNTCRRPHEPSGADPAAPVGDVLPDAASSPSIATCPRLAGVTGPRAAPGTAGRR
jgi:hypothetical protein